MAAYYDMSLKKYAVIDTHDGFVIGYYDAKSKDDAIGMAKADRDRCKIGDD